MFPFAMERQEIPICSGLSDTVKKVPRIIPGRCVVIQQLHSILSTSRVVIRKAPDFQCRHRVRRCLTLSDITYRMNRLTGNTCSIRREKNH